MAISVVRPVPARFGISGEYLQTTDVWTPERPHLGVDFNCPGGTDVVSATITAKVHAVHRPGDGWGDGSFGICIVMDVIGTPWYYLYGHLSAVLVTVGETVPPGQLIAKSGATGFVTGPHLHVQASESPDFPRNIDITGDPILGLRGLPVDVPDVPGSATVEVQYIAASLNNLNTIVADERLANKARDEALSNRLTGIEKAIQALVNALPKG